MRTVAPRQSAFYTFFAALGHVYNLQTVTFQFRIEIHHISMEAGTTLSILSLRIAINAVHIHFGDAFDVKALTFTSNFAVRNSM